MAGVEQLEFGWKFGDSLTPESFKRVLEDSVDEIHFIELDAHGYTIPAFRWRGVIPQFVILIKQQDSLVEQEKTLVHEILHIHRGLDFLGKANNMFKTKSPSDEIKKVDEETQIEGEAERFINANYQLVSSTLLRYKS